MKSLSLTKKLMKKNWEKMGELDPLWAILSEPSKRGHGWDVDEFFANGQLEIQDLMEYASEVFDGRPKNDALDFGCGVGRLTQPLADYFSRVVGVDISSSMIDLANQYNKKGDRCKYVVNTRIDLKDFVDSSFDYINSLITLQHIEPEYSRKYLKEFMRLLRPGGVLLFQLTSHRKKDEGNDVGSRQKGARGLFRRSVSSLYWKIKDQIFLRERRRKIREDIQSDKPIIPMYGIEKQEVVELITGAGGRIEKISDDPSAGDDWVSYRYVVVKG